MSDFLLFFLPLTAAMAFLAWVGYLVGRDVEAEERRDQRQALDAAWTALEQSRRVNEVFFHARDAMRQAETEATAEERSRRP